MKFYGEGTLPQRTIIIRAQHSVTKVWHTCPVLDDLDFIIEAKIRLAREGFDNITVVRKEN